MSKADSGAKSRNTKRERHSRHVIGQKIERGNRLQSWMGVNYKVEAKSSDPSGKTGESSK
jgi:hypothetical protein